MFRPRRRLIIRRKAKMISPRRLYLNSDRSKIVEHGSSEAAFLLVAKGGDIDARTEKQYSVAEYLKENPDEKPCPIDTGHGLNTGLPKEAHGKKPESQEPAKGKPAKGK